MKFSEYLKQQLSLAMSKWQVPDITKRDVLIANLVFCWHLMRASEPLLELAVKKSKGHLKTYFKEHLEEERGHEKWLADDLLSVGVDVTKTPLPRLAVEMVGTQYYLINHVNPAALLGYMARHEAFPLNLDVVAQLEELHGKQLLRTVRYHAENDVGHARELLNMVDELPRASQSIILENAIQSACYFGAAQQSFSS